MLMNFSLMTLGMQKKKMLSGKSHRLKSLLADAPRGRQSQPGDSLTGHMQKIAHRANSHRVIDVKAMSAKITYSQAVMTGPLPSQGVSPKMGHLWRPVTL
jgi:hypothetical protein